MTRTANLDQLAEHERRYREPAAQCRLAAALQDHERCRLAMFHRDWHPWLVPTWSARARLTESRRPLSCTYLAERVGFEPTVSFPTHDFQSCRFGRSRTPPVP